MPNPIDLPTIVSSTSLDPAAEVIAVECSRCRDLLDLIQPDACRPDRLLGICVGCGGWALIEIDRQAEEATVATLPRQIRGA